MKKKVAAMLTMMLAVGLIGGCGNKKEPTDTDSTNGTGTAQSEAGSTEDENIDIKPLKDWNMHDYVTFGEYKGIKITVAPMEEAAQEDIDSLAVAAYNDSMGGITNRAVADGDTVKLDYVGKKDGVAFDGGTASNASLTIGSGSFIEGFESGLIGVMPGTPVDLNLKFPEPYDNNPDLAGKDVVFTVTVNSINLTDAADMTDEGVASAANAEYTTVQELKDYCKEYLEYMAENTYSTARDSAIIEQLMTVSTFTEVPKELTAKYKKNIMETIEARAAQAGATADEYANYYYGTTAEAYADQYAEESAKQSIAFFAIADTEGLLVSDEELETSLAEYAKKVGAPSVEDMLGDLDKEEFREFFTFEKVMDFLFDNAEVTDSTAATDNSGAAESTAETETAGETKTAR